MNKKNGVRFLIVLILSILFTSLFAETIILNFREEISGEICGIDKKNIYVKKDKTLFIIHISQIAEILDVQNQEIELELYG